MQERVINILKEQLFEDNISIDDSFESDLMIDSLDRIEMVFAFEEEFGIEIADEEAEGLKTVSDAVDLVDRKIAVKAGKCPFCRK